jgi:hypothetical protein
MLYKIFLLFSFIPCSRGLSLPQMPGCKASAGSVDWPDVETWNQFNSSVSGRLLMPLPPAQPCYIGGRNTSASKDCNRATESWFESAYHSNDPVSVAYPNWQHDACLPVSLYSQPRNCSPSFFPKYVVNASSSADVSATLRFVAAHNVRLVVKGGGHDLLGR